MPFFKPRRRRSELPAAFLRPSILYFTGRLIYVIGHDLKRRIDHVAETTVDEAGRAFICLLRK